MEICVEHESNVLILFFTDFVVYFTDVATVSDSEWWEEEAKNGTRNFEADRLLVECWCFCAIGRPQHWCCGRATAVPGYCPVNKEFVNLKNTELIW